MLLNQPPHHISKELFLSVVISRINQVNQQGECAGQLAMLTGEANFYTCEAREVSRVAILSREDFFEIVSETPRMVLSLAHNVIRRLSSLVRQVCSYCS